jgi:flavin-dependent dehydrogenase
MNERVDCVVIGGGPAGSTAANLLASHGRRVVVLEREHFPRYHIGESLLPGVLPMLDVLGALEEVEAFGFQRKTGQTFCWNPKDPCWELNFHDLERFNYTYFVTRADFDAILLNTARAKGAEVREGCRVRQVRFDGDTAIGVTYEDATGAVVHLDSRYVIDASGSQALLAKRFRLRHFTETMKSFAVWGYYRGFDRIEAQGKQHLLTATFRDGWIWCIPLHDGLTSIGVVTARDLVPEGLNKRAREAWYEGILHGTPAVRDRLQHAERTTGLQVARDWSYRCKRRSGPGWALAGEAGGFIDPLLSYGIQFAMNSSYLAAMAVHNALREPAYSEPFFQYFEDTTRTLYEDLFAAVEAFYSYQCSQDSVYWRTKELVGRERGESPYRSFLYVSAGFLGNEAFGGQPSEGHLRLRRRPRHARGSTASRDHRRLGSRRAAARRAGGAQHPRRGAWRPADRRGRRDGAVRCGPRRIRVAPAPPRPARGHRGRGGARRARDQHDARGRPAGGHSRARGRPGLQVAALPRGRRVRGWIPLPASRHGRARVRGGPAGRRPRGDRPGRARSRPREVGEPSSAARRGLVRAGRPTGRRPARDHHAG